VRIITDMNMKITYSILFLSMLGLLNSCCGLHTEVKYQYNDVNIKRVDICGKSMFYYNKVGSEKNEGLIWAEYSGINAGFKGYLVFEDNGKVLLLSGDGYFQSKDNDTTLFEFKRITAINRPDLKENTCLIMLSTRYEQEFNDTTNTKIEANYVIDNNEWW
jgi:hypothetical protein